MNLKDYFETAKGVGVMSTADADGRVDAAVYAKPHFMDDGTLAFISRDRLTHENLKSNPHAHYLFKEDGPGYKGKRLFLTKVREEKNSPLIESLARRKRDIPSSEDRFLVFFELDRELSLIGDTQG